MIAADDLRAQIVQAACGWLRTPYHHRARVKGVGVDCAMLVLAVMAEAGAVPDFDPGDYPRDWMLHRSEERFLAHIRAHAVEVADPLPGDVVMYRFGRCFAHAGIVTDWPAIIHADSRSGCVTEASGDAGRLRNRERSYWRALALCPPLHAGEGLGVRADGEVIA